MDYAIRTMSRAEVELTLDWAAAEGWNPGLGDATPFQAADPNGFLMGTVDERPAAAISVVRYGGKFGFLGLYIVAPAHRGRGYGLLLWRAGLEHLGGRSIGLDGVVAQQANYRRSGFTYAWPNFRFGGTVESRADPQLVDARTLPFRDVENLDRPLFPGPRPSFLAAWLAMPDSRSLALVEDGTMTAFGTIRRCRSGWKVGPLYADDEEFGRTRAAWPRSSASRRRAVSRRSRPERGSHAAGAKAGSCGALRDCSHVQGRDTRTTNRANLRDHVLRTRMSAHSRSCLISKPTCTRFGRGSWARSCGAFDAPAIQRTIDELESRSLSARQLT